MSINTETAIEESLTAQILLSRLGTPYRDRRVLSELYYGRYQTLEGVAERLDCSPSTVRNWMDKAGLKRRDGRFRRRERATFCHAPGGYEMWVAHEPPRSTSAVYVHGLAVIADGADPYEVFSDEGLVHHRNCQPFDNRPENLEVLSATQHSRTHKRAVWTVDDRLGCRVLQTAERGDYHE